MVLPLVATMYYLLCVLIHFWLEETLAGDLTCKDLCPLMGAPQPTMSRLNNGSAFDQCSTFLEQSTLHRRP